MSADIIDFFDAASNVAEGIKKRRLELGLSLVEAANILNISPTTLEREESKYVDQPRYNEILRKYEIHIASSDGKRKGNLIFNALPLRVARIILDLNIEEMANRYGYSPSYWKRLETNFRSIQKSHLDKIENDVKQHFAKLCSNT